MAASLVELKKVMRDRRFQNSDVDPVASQLPSYMPDNDQKRQFGRRWREITENRMYSPVMPAADAKIEFIWDALHYLDLERQIAWRISTKEVWLPVIRAACAQQGISCESCRAYLSLFEESTRPPDSPARSIQGQSAGRSIDWRRMFPWLARLLGED